MQINIDKRGEHHKKRLNNIKAFVKANRNRIGDYRRHRYCSDDEVKHVLARDAWESMRLYLELTKETKVIEHMEHIIDCAWKQIEKAEAK